MSADWVIAIFELMYTKLNWLPRQPQAKFEKALISQNDRLDLFYKCSEFHACTVKCTIQPMFVVSNWTTMNNTTVSGSSEIYISHWW